jgi:uncharacterized protein with ParB-like and HNH nuclease domain
MNFREETVGNLFSRANDKNFSIPDYQRAYSWENEADNKTDSAFIFELQNNKGRDITEMEQVKAFLMYQIYTNENAAAVNTAIEKISELFESI